jgi:signal transduction histidine kinase
MTELKQLEREILRISEAEQRRIGHDLHDGLCQQLAGIEFISQALEQRLATRKAPEAATAAQIARLIREAITHTRDLAKGLSPVILEPDGLMSSLKMLAANVTKLFRVDCRLHCPKPVLIQDNSVATHLFRIAQEAVNNAIRHGSARRLEFRLTATAEHITLAVKDDGCGISLPTSKSKGMGLRIMQSRASTMGGTLAIQKQKNHGTTVLCRVPQPPSPQHHEKGKKDTRRPVREKDPHRR